jgi:hypothetical protein
VTQCILYKCLHDEIIVFYYDLMSDVMKVICRGTVNFVYYEGSRKWLDILDELNVNIKYPQTLLHN